LARSDPRDTATCAPATFSSTWALRTIGSAYAAYDFETVHLYSDDAVLAVDLPRPSNRIVIETDAGEGSRRVTVRQPVTGREREIVGGPGNPAHIDLRFPESADRYEITLHPPGWVTFVGYEA
jgi:hypothetical protein